MKMDGKVVIVTGGSSGIGKGITYTLAKEGAFVVVADINEESGYRIVEELKPYVMFVKTDVRDNSSVRNMVDQVIKKFSKIDVLINNAGYADGKDVETQTEEEWNEMFDTNVNGYARCIRAALPYLKQTKGNILNTASLVGLNGQAKAFGYCSTKGAIIGMVKNLAIDLAPYGIRVNAICPGWIHTEMLEYKWTKRQPNPDSALSDLAKKHPLGRIGTPDDCGKAALYLCSEDASFVTGITLNLDGGITLGYK